MISGHPRTLPLLNGPNPITNFQPFRINGENHLVAVVEAKFSSTSCLTSIRPSFRVLPQPRLRRKTQGRGALMECTLYSGVSWSLGHQVHALFSETASSVVRTTSSSRYPQMLVMASKNRQCFKICHSRDSLHLSTERWMLVEIFVYA